MVFIEKIDNPFDEFYLESFGNIREEQNMKDALKYTTDVTGNILMNKKIDAFTYHGYSFITCLIKDESDNWLGYINLYNDIFVKNQLKKFKKLVLPLLEKLVVKSEMADFYYKKLKSFECQSADIESINKIILENFSAEELIDYCLEFQKIVFLIPSDLYIEIGLYETVNVFLEDVNSLVEQLRKVLDEHPDFSDCNIIIKSEKDDIVFGNIKYKKEERGDFNYFYLKESSNLKRALTYQENEE